MGNARAPMGKITPWGQKKKVGTEKQPGRKKRLGTEKSGDKQRWEQTDKLGLGMNKQWGPTNMVGTKGQGLLTLARLLVSIVWGPIGHRIYS